MEKKISIIFLIIILALLGRKSVGQQGELIEVNQYKNIPIVQNIIELSDEDIEQEIKDYLNIYAEEVEVIDKDIQNGDYIDIEGTYDIKGNIEKINYTDYEVGCTSHQVQEFDKYFIGRRLNDTITFTIEYEEDMSDAILAGKKVKYNITIKKVIGYQYPELNEDFVINTLGYESIDEFYTFIIEKAHTNYEKLEIERVKEQLLDYMVKNTVINEFPVDEYERIYNDLKRSFEGYAELYDIDIEKLLVSSGIENGLEEHARDIAIKNTVIKYIADREKLNISKMEYKKVAKEYVREHGYKNINEFINDCGEDYLNNELLKERVMNYIYDNAKISYN